MPDRIDLAGQKIGRLTVLEPSLSRKGHSYWKCLCECGKEKSINTQSLKQGYTKSCGCYNADMARARKYKKVAGQKFGLLTAIKRIPKSESLAGRTKWLCKCACGNETVVETSRLTLNITQSCGCKKNPKGENHPSWKNGKRLTSGGYIYVYALDHPRSSKANQVLEHRLVMEEHLGRYLLPTENIHHKNGIKTDNRIENLELWSRTQPVGQRVEDLISFAVEILSMYAPERLKGENLDAPKTNEDIFIRRPSPEVKV